MAVNLYQSNIFIYSSGKMRVKNKSPPHVDIHDFTEYKITFAVISM